MAERECLNCGETPSSIKRDRIVLCGIVEGYETPELAYEFPHHRWADWQDGELSRMGVNPEAFDKHRRTPAMHFQWLACEDMVRGHIPLTAEQIAEDAKHKWPMWDGMKPGQCLACGKMPADTEEGDREPAEV